MWGCLPTKISSQRKFLRLRYKGTLVRCTTSCRPLFQFALFGVLRIIKDYLTSLFCWLRLRDTVDHWTVEAHNGIHFVVPRNSIMVRTCKQALQATCATRIFTVERPQRPIIFIILLQQLHNIAAKVFIMLPQ